MYVCVCVGFGMKASKKKLLVEAKLTFSRAVEVALSMEAAANKTRQLQRNDPGEETVNCTSPDNQPTDCYRCGCSNHPSALCPFKNYRCHNCGKLGHIKDVCRSAPRGHYYGGKRRRRTRVKGWGQGRGIQELQGEIEEEEDPRHRRYGKKTSITYKP